MLKLGFIGGGNMGGAIMRGVSHNLKSPLHIFAFDKDSEKLSEIAKLGITTCKDEREIVQNCEFVLLAVKPQSLAEVLDTVADLVTEKTVFISICAGIPAEFIQAHTRPDARVILVMPNTPMMLGLGASAIARGEGISDSEFNFAKSVISSCGIVQEIPIDKMKEIICINSSSPAFLYLFAKGFIDYAGDVGIDSDAAMKLFAQMLVGSAKMLTDSGMTVDELIKQVSSPGGTTIAGLNELYDGKLTEIVHKACEACTKRAYELAQ